MNRPSNVAGDLVFVGYGIVAPEYQLGRLPGVDVKNKIVVALVNDPGLRDSTIFRGKILTYYGRWTYKIEEAQRQGAAGILLVHTTEERDLSLDHGPVELDRTPGSNRGASDVTPRCRLAHQEPRQTLQPGGQNLET